MTTVSLYLRAPSLTDVLVQCCTISSETEDDALVYAIHNQRDRRNLAPEEIIHCIEALDKKKKTGPKPNLASGDAKSSTGKSAQETARILGVSQATVERARTVLDHADEETRKAVESGEMSMNKAYEQTQERRGYETLYDKQAAGSPSHFIAHRFYRRLGG